MRLPSEYSLQSNGFKFSPVVFSSPTRMKSLSCFLCRNPELEMWNGVHGLNGNCLPDNRFTDLKPENANSHLLGK
jgi:hypothetical protein